MRDLLQRIAGKFGYAPVTKSAGAWEGMFPGAGGASADLTRPYALSTWVHRAVRYVSGPLESVPLVWAQDARGGDVAVDDAELTAFWEKPAKTRGGMLGRTDFVRALVGWLLLKGEFFLVLDDTWLSRSAKKSPLIVARPDQMREITDKDRELVGWMFTDGASRKHALIPEQVIQVKQWNPYNDYRGLSDWEAAKIAADSDYAAGVFARNLMSNNGDRGVYVIAKAGTPSDDQIKQITAMLRQKRELSRKGDFRPVFLTADVDVKEPSLESVDAAYVAQRMSNATEVFLAFGVPPSFATVTASYSVGSASDRFKLIEETCMPISNSVADALERVEHMRTGRSLFATFKFDDHSVMQQVRAERVESAAKMVEKGVPWRTASDYLGMKLPRFKGDDVGRVAFNFVPVEDDEPAADPAPSPATLDTVGELEQLFAQRAATKKAASKAVAEQRAHDIWAQVHKSREAWEVRMRKRVSRFLMDARATTLRNLAAATKEKMAVQKADVLEIIFSLDSWLAEWIRGLSAIDRNALEAAGAECWTDELGKDDPLTMPAEDVSLAMSIRENRIKNAGEKIWTEVKAAIEKAVEAGQTNDQLAATIKATFKGIDDKRSRTIAATEITVAYETGRDMTFKAAGVEWTQWLHSGLSDHARPAHQAAHEQIREMGEPFDIGGVPLLFPGDPAAPADEVINCRCVRIAVAGPDTDDIEGNNNPDIPW